MSYLYLIQLLSSAFGYKQYIAYDSKTSLLDFAFFRTKLCKFLFENAEIIDLINFDYKINTNITIGTGTKQGKVHIDKLVITLSLGL